MTSQIVIMRDDMLVIDKATTEADKQHLTALFIQQETTQSTSDE